MVKTKDIVKEKVKKAISNNNTANKHEHYYTEEPESDLVIGNFSYTYNNHDYVFNTSSGVFGKRRADKGTMLLLSSVPDLNNKTVLDLGCGIGIVAIVLSKNYPKGIFHASDINKRAVMLTKKNAKNNNARIIVHHSDGLERINTVFDIILLNPPQSAGKDMCNKLIRESYDGLNYGGSLLLVARKNKGGRSLSDYMESVFGNCNDIAIKSGYHVYRSIKE